MKSWFDLFVFLCGHCLLGSPLTPCWLECLIPCRPDLGTDLVCVGEGVVKPGQREVCVERWIKRERFYGAQWLCCEGCQTSRLETGGYHC